jgi:TolB-like protein/Tfp pilus assembly protein PilF
MLVENSDDMVGTDRRSVRRANSSVVVKIIDFGLAKALRAPVDPMSLTRGRFVGTPEFASPEQFEHCPLDVRSDIYSLGATLWFALTGGTPFAGHKVEEIHRAQQSDALPMEQLKAARVPSRLRLLLESMLALEPASRPGIHELAARLQRCSPEAHHALRTRVALASTAILILGVSAFFMFLSLRTQNSVSNPRIAEKSIAVLPFENLSQEMENAYFTDGVQDEILTDLAKIADLKVISRSSVMQYQAGNPRNLREIGQQLGVAHVLEGSVQRAHGKVRVNAHLMDARTDEQLWAKTYDRDVADVFAIESEVAQLIASELQAKLSASEKASIEERPTPDLTAYDFYVRAIPLIEQIAYSPTQEMDLSVAVDLLNQAVARDPSFLLAWCGLGNAHDQVYFQGIDRTTSRLALAKSAIDSAFRLKPGSGEAHLALASHLYYGYFDFDRARVELAIAQRTLPNNPEVFELAGLIDRRQSRWSDAMRNMERASELDPRNPWKLENLAVTYFMLRDYGRDKSTLIRILALDPNNVAVRTTLASREIYWRADTRPLRDEIEKVLTENPAQAESDDIKRARFALAMFERDFAAADRAVAVLPQQDSLWDGYSRDFWVGVVARMKGDVAAARAAFTIARADRDKQIREQPDNGSFVSALGVIDAGLDRKEEALREGRRAMEITPIAKDSIVGVAALAHFAIICAWTGEHDLAIDQLEAVMKIPGCPSYGELRLHPFWDPLRGDPRFEKIVASVAPKGK